MNDTPAPPAKKTPTDRLAEFMARLQNVDRFVTSRQCRRTHRLVHAGLVLIAALIAALVYFAASAADAARSTNENATRALQVALEAAAHTGRVEAVVTERTAAIDHRLAAIEAELRRVHNVLTKMDHQLGRIDEPHAPQQQAATPLSSLSSH